MTQSSRNMMRKIAVLVLVALAGYTCLPERSFGLDQEGPKAVVHFTRFVKTYNSIRLANFEMECDYEIHFYGEHEFIKDLVETLESERTQLNFDDDVRLKLLITGKKTTEYYVDHRGVVLRDGMEKFLLTRDKMKSISERILAFHGIVDARPTAKPRY